MPFSIVLTREAPAIVAADRPSLSDTAPTMVTRRETQRSATA
jgi:hypothetical protein